MICILSCYCIRAYLENHSHNLHAPLCGIFHLNSVAVARVCLENHSRNLYAPLCDIFCPNLVSVTRYDALIRTKSPINCDAHLVESIFQTHSRNSD